MKKFWPALVILLLGTLLAGIFSLKKKIGVETEPVLEGGEVKMDLTGKKVLMVVAPKNFRDEEFSQPKKVLEENGASVVVTAKDVSQARGMLGTEVLVDQKLAEVKVDDYDAIVFVGGSGAAVYFDDQTAINLAKNAFGQGKVVGAICIAPSILANAGILSGKKATAFSSESTNLTAKGAQYTGEAVTVDGKIVTADGPQSATEFGRKIAEILAVY